jgi:nitrogenase subunit NifH
MRFKTIYEGSKAYDVMSAGYKSFDEVAKDLKKFQNIASVLSNKLSTEISNSKNKLLNYGQHSKYGHINDAHAQSKIKELEAKKKTIDDRLKMMNDSNNYSKLKTWIKEAEKEL